MKYIQEYALFLMLIFCTPCVGQNNPAPPKEKIKSETKDIVTSPGSNEKYHTKYEYTDIMGQNLFYRISRLDSTPAHSLMDEKEINCGSINLKNLMSRK